MNAAPERRHSGWRISRHFYDRELFSIIVKRLTAGAGATVNIMYVLVHFISANSFGKWMDEVERK